MAAKLERRVSALERSNRSMPANCFWCECEGDAQTENCSHRAWPAITHEDALGQLDKETACVRS
jgi:hypothetical protein